MAVYPTQSGNSPKLTLYAAASTLRPDAFCAITIAALNPPPAAPVASARDSIVAERMDGLTCFFAAPEDDVIVEVPEAICFLEVADVDVVRRTTSLKVIFA